MKKVALLYAPHSATGKALAEVLQDLGDYYHFSFEAGKELHSDEPYDLLIRWGSIASVNKKPRKILNSRDAISQASNKINSLYLMVNKGINTPPFFEVGSPGWAAPLVDYPYLARKSKHTQGKDIVLCLQRSDIEECINSGNAEYFVKYIPTKQEYRIHVFCNEAIKVSEKVLTGESHGSWIRNFENGYTFRNPEVKPSYAAIGMAIDAVNAHGLHFGAVDLIVGDDDTPYVLEVNTAPGLIESSAEEYVDAFAKAISSKLELAH